MFYKFSLKTPQRIIITQRSTGRQVSWVVKKSFRLTKLKIEDEIDNMQTQNWISYNEIEILKFCLVNTSL